MVLKIKQRIFALFLLILFGNPVFTQNNNTVNLELQVAIERTLNNNRQIKIADFDYQASLQDIEKMKSVYLPQVEATATGSANNIPLHAFGTKLQQGAIQQSDFNPDFLNEPSSISNLQTQFMVRQPILNLDAKPMKEAVVAKSNAFNFQSIRTKNVLKNHVAQAYLQLQLIYEMKEVLLQAKKTAEANLKLAQDNLEAGYIQRADVLSVEVRINEIENQLFETENNIQNISDQLSFLMGSSYGEKYQPADELVFKNDSANLSNNIPADRSDIKAMQSQVEAFRHMLSSAEKTSLPRINAFGSYELNNSFDFDDSQHGYLLGIQASWLIFNGNKNRSDAAKAKIEFEKSEIQLEHLIAQNNLEFHLAKRKIMEAEQKIKLTEKSIEQSKETLRIKTDRYAEGMEKTTDILIAETKVSQKELEYIEAVYQYEKAKADLILILEQK